MSNEEIENDPVVTAEDEKIARAKRIASKSKRSPEKKIHKSTAKEANEQEQTEEMMSDVKAEEPQVQEPILEEKPAKTVIEAKELQTIPPASQYNFFTERELDKILSNLDTLRNDVYPQLNLDAEDQTFNHNFPSVCLIGLGRCGSNIALEVATLVYRARSFYLNEFKSQEKQRLEKDSRPFNWIRKRLHLSDSSSLKPIFLIEPIVMLGDLDKDIAGRIRYSSQTEDGKFLENYTKMKIMDLSEVHAGGAGNAPILGQYLAKIILNKDTEKFTNQDWKFIHSYLIDSCGIKANQSRLYFYIFSSGGGTGSGMASEFGLAQQYAYMRKTFEIRPADTEGSNRHSSFVFEPIFTSGICILPNISSQKVSVSEALHINSGRLLCKYLAEEWDFSYNYEDEAESEASVLERIRPWNAMLLISNDIMRYAEESDDGVAEDIDVNSMEKYANQYISQQIFNILTAQAVTTDYDENYFRRAGIDIGETIRLDANDLFMSLAGPVAVAYAESIVPHTEGVFSDKHPHVDIDDLFYRSIELPHFNKDTQAIEGVSLLPIESERYKEALQQYKSTGYDASTLNNLHFFKNCSSIVSIVSLPKDFKLSYVDLNRLKSHLNSLFPNTTLKRYALVIGTSANLSLTTLIAKSPCLSDDFITLIVAYIKRCFGKDLYRYDETIDQVILELIRSDDFDEERIDALLNDYESPAKILDTNWFAIKPMYEKKYREMIHDEDKFQSINDIRLSSEHIKKTIRYLREIYRHRISRTKILSLNE